MTESNFLKNFSCEFIKFLVIALSFGISVLFKLWLNEKQVNKDLIENKSKEIKEFLEHSNEEVTKQIESKFDTLSKEAKVHLNEIKNALNNLEKSINELSSIINVLQNAISESDTINSNIHNELMKVAVKLDELISLKNSIIDTIRREIGKELELFNLRSRIKNLE